MKMIMKMKMKKILKNAILTYIKCQEKNIFGQCSIRLHLLSAGVYSKMVIYNENILSSIQSFFDEFLPISLIYFCFQNKSFFTDSLHTIFIYLSLLTFFYISYELYLYRYSFFQQLFQLYYY